MLRLTRVLRPAATALRRQRRPASFVRCFSEGADEAAPANPAAEGQENLYGGPDNWDPKVGPAPFFFTSVALFVVTRVLVCCSRVVPGACSLFLFPAALFVASRHPLHSLLLQVEAIVDQIGHLNLFEVAEFVECLRVKLNLQDVPMGVAMVGGGDAGAEEGGEVWNRACDRQELHACRSYCPYRILIVVVALRVRLRRKKRGMYLMSSWKASMTRPRSRSSRSCEH